MLGASVAGDVVHSPTRCILHADNIHALKKPPSDVGKMGGKVVSTCPTPVKEQWNWAQMQRYFGGDRWINVGTYDLAHKFAKKEAIAKSKHVCQSSSDGFRVIGDGWIVDVDGVQYFALNPVGSRIAYNPCGL